MTRYIGSPEDDNFIGTSEDDNFRELGRGNDQIDGGDQYDFLSYRRDGGSAGIVAVFGADGNGTVVDTFGDTDTITSVQGLEGSTFADQFTFQAGADFNVQPDRGADRIVITGHDFGTIDYAYYFTDEVTEFVRELNLDITGLTLDFAAGRVTEFDGTVDTFTPVDQLSFRGTSINDIMKGGDDGFRTRLDGRGGSDTIIGGDAYDMASFEREGDDIGGGFNINLETGRASNNSNNDVDTLINIRSVEGSRFADNFIGSGAAEQFYGRAGDDVIAGEGGIDTAIYWNHGRWEFTVSGIGTDTITVAHAGDQGTDTLTNVERLNFENGLLRVDIGGNAGQAYRLYEAAFDRTPDQSGLSYWIDRLDTGISLSAVADSFLASDEFKDRYGDPDAVSNSTFLTQLYQNILDRAPEQAGFDYWLGELNNGLDRGELLIAFSESDENVANLTGQLQNGIFFEYS